MLRSLSRQLPIPHLFMAVSIVACLLMVASMLGLTPGSALDAASMGAVSMDGARVVDAQEP